MADEEEHQKELERFRAFQIATRSPLSLTDGQPIAPYSILNARYVMRKIIGRGGSSYVWACKDIVRKQNVAVKIIDNDRSPYEGFGAGEVQFNTEIGNIEASGIHFPRMLDHFKHSNHLCIVFERLGPSIYHVLQGNPNHPLPMSFVRDVGRQLLERVEFLHRSRFIHTDLKPENILFVSRLSCETPASKIAPGLIQGVPQYDYLLPTPTTIKVIDLGSAHSDKALRNDITGTRGYRAPEVILGLVWSFPCDIWSVGCILAELCLGFCIFKGTEDMENLALMEALLGRFPSQMLERVMQYVDASKYVKDGMLNWPEGATSPESVQRVQCQQDLLQMLRLVCGSEDFIQLVLHLLKHDPSDRLTAKEALNHPFFIRDSLN